MTKYIQFKTYKPYNFTTMVNDIQIRVHIRYNSYLNRYYMNIDKQIEGEYINIVNSIMLTTGVDLFNQFEYLGLGKLYIIPIRTELYNSDPSSETIQNYMIMWETDNV